MIGFWLRKECRLCSCKYLTKILSLTPTPPANAFVPAALVGQAQECFPLDLWMCDACSHMQLLDIVDPSALFTDYVYVSGTSPVFVSHFENYAKDISERFDLKPNDLVVDIGSNDGTLLSFFKKSGQRVLGVDPAKAIAKKATAAGIETLPEFLSASLANNISQKYGLARVVTANNVFAHADDLAGFTEAVKMLMAPDGVFVFEVSYLADVYEKNLCDTIYAEHTSYHSVSPLVSFFARHGMQLIETIRTPTHGGSIRCIVQLNSGKRSVGASVSQAMRLEEHLELAKPATWVYYAKEIDHVGLCLRGVLDNLKSQGKTIAGYGAPAKATTLMYHFGIDIKSIDFIVDDSPLKQGLFTPGLHIPVLPSSILESRKPGLPFDPCLELRRFDHC